MSKLEIISDTHVKAIIIVIIGCLLSIPFFLYKVPYEITIRNPHPNASGIAGESIEFVINIELKGGHADRIFKVNIDDDYGNWEIEPNDRPFVIAPDSTKVIIITCHIPGDAQVDGWWITDYEITGDIISEPQQLSVKVENGEANGDTYPISWTDRRINGSDRAISPLVFIPETIIVISVIALFTFIRRSKKLKDIEDPKTT